MQFRYFSDWKNVSRKSEKKEKEIDFANAMWFSQFNLLFASLALLQ